MSNSTVISPITSSSTDTTNAIVYIITSCLVAGWIFYGSRKQGGLSTPAKFIICGLTFSIIGAIFILAVQNAAIQFGGSTIAYVIADCIYYVMITWLFKRWIDLVEWEISPVAAKTGRGVSNTNYFLFIIFAILLIVDVIIVLLGYFTSALFGLLFIIFNFVIVAGLFTQTMAVFGVHQKEASGVTPEQKKQLRFVLILTAILLLVQLIYTLAYWFPVLAPISTVIAFLWLVAIMWPGSLNGFDKTQQTSQYPMQNRNDNAGGGQQQRPSPMQNRNDSAGGGQQQRPSPFV